jgi:O-antigen ligase
VSLLRSVSAAGGWTFDVFQGEADPLNGLRVFKSVAAAALFWPLLRSEIRADREAAVRRLAAGMLAGLTIVELAVLWERSAYPGFLDFSTRYRTTALFWEMHVGGAALDAYLALAAPFVAWWLWSARSWPGWCAAAVLALLTGYAVLTTFSRGVYFAVGASLVLLAVLMAARDSRGWRSVLARAAVAGAMLMVAAVSLASAYAVAGLDGFGLALGALAVVVAVLQRARERWSRRRLASMALGLGLMLEVVGVLGLGTFMRDRASRSDTDFGTRLEHWQRGISFLREPADWLAGIGLGRLPAAYDADSPASQFTGSVHFVSDGVGQGGVQLSGPRSRTGIAGVMALTQRVALRSGVAYRASFDVQGVTGAVVSLSVCELHLLYPRACQRRIVRIASAPREWRHLSLTLHGPSLTRGEPWLPRLAVFSIAVINAGGIARFDNVSLTASNATELLANGGFADGLARWFPLAQGYFVPWHIDNLYLEVGVERGLPALLALVAAMGLVLWRLVNESGRANGLAPFLAASIFGGACVGLVSSIMDAPRVAFLLLLVMIASFELTASRGRVQERVSGRAPPAVPEAESATGPCSRA